MNALLMIHDAIKKIEEAAGCTCFLASECDPKPAMYARLYWEEPKPSSGVIWENGQAWTVLPLDHSKHKKALLDVIDALPRKEIYQFIHSIEEKIVDGGRVEFAAIVDVLYIRVSWSDLSAFCWEYGFGKDHFDEIEIKIGKLIDRINTSKSSGDTTIGFRRLSNE